MNTKYILSLSEKNQHLWARLESYSFPKGIIEKFERQYPFIANETTPFLFDEFKKFVFLSCISNDTIIISQRLDLIWHHYLTFTKEFWDIFCKEVLQREFHHLPSDGSQEAFKIHKKAYEATLDFYEVVFGTLAPESAWELPADRFSLSIYQYVDSSKYACLASKDLNKLALLPSIIVGLIFCLTLPYDFKWASLILGWLTWFIIVIHFDKSIILLTRKVNNQDDSCCGCG